MGAESSHSNPLMFKKLINVRLRDLANAADYAAWKQIALELDRVEGADAWK